MSAPPLLDLNTLITRPTIVIDEKKYEIISPEELSILDSQRMVTRGQRMEELMAGGEPDQAAKDELEAIVIEISETVLAPVPKTVRKKLKEAHRLAVIEVFTTLLLEKRLGRAAAAMMGMAAKAMKTGTAEQPTGE